MLSPAPMGTSYHPEFKHPRETSFCRARCTPFEQTKDPFIILLRCLSTSLRRQDDCARLLPSSPIFSKLQHARTDKHTIDGLPVLQLHHRVALCTFVVGSLPDNIDDFSQTESCEIKTLCNLEDLPLYLDVPLIQSHRELALSQVLESFETYECLSGLDKYRPNAPRATLLLG